MYCFNQFFQRLKDQLQYSKNEEETEFSVHILHLDLTVQEQERYYFPHTPKVPVFWQTYL